MRDHANNLSRSSWLSTSLILGSLVLVIGVLYLAREILIPIALAILLTFILAPIVTMLRRRGLGRTWSVTLTVALTFLLLGGIGTVIVHQLRSLVDDLPTYRQNISQKISDLRVASRGGSLEKVQETVKGVMQEVNQASPATGTNTPAVPVMVTNHTTNQPDVPLIGSLLEPLATAGLVIVLVIFMSLRREDLRDRLLGLAGPERLAFTTKAIDEAGKLVSRYLFRQFLLNSGFGLVIGIGFFSVGLPYAILWGVLAAVARFIPYAGPIMGGVAPILMSFAVFDTWTTPLLVVGLVITLELIHNMLVEPLVYGQSIGVSEVALLVMVAFWTWLWGPIGLVLAAPLTVCLMVISKSVPDLKFIGMLLSSEPALTPFDAFYQRLVAKDKNEALEIVGTYLKEHERADLFDHLLLPALLACRRDSHRRRITDADQAFAFQLIRQIIDGGGSEGRRINPTPRLPAPGGRPRRLPAMNHRGLIGCPAHDEADELALLMLAKLLGEDGVSMQVLSAELLWAETLVELEKARPAAVCVGGLPGDSTFAARQLCKRLRARHPELPVVAGCWPAASPEKLRQNFIGLANEFSGTLAETRSQLIRLSQAKLPLHNARIDSRATLTANRHKAVLQTEK